MNPILWIYSSCTPLILFSIFSGIGVLSLLLVLLIVGVAVFIYKVKSSARNAIKKDINPLYGVDYEGEADDQNPRPMSAEQSYNYMGE